VSSYRAEQFGLRYSQMMYTTMLNTKPTDVPTGSPFGLFFFIWYNDKRTGTGSVQPGS